MQQRRPKATKKKKKLKKKEGSALSVEDLITISLIQHSSAFYDHLVPATLNNVNDKILLFRKKRMTVGLSFMQFAAVSVGCFF